MLCLNVFIRVVLLFNNGNSPNPAGAAAFDFNGKTRDPESKGVWNAVQVGHLFHVAILALTSHHMSRQESLFAMGPHIILEHNAGGTIKSPPINSNNSNALIQ